MRICRHREKVHYLKNEVKELLAKVIGRRPWRRHGPTRHEIGASSRPRWPCVWVEGGSDVYPYSRPGPVRSPLSPLKAILKQELNSNFETADSYIRMFTQVRKHKLVILGAEGQR